MKVLFIGIGLTHYYNQTLNRLHQEPGIEIYDLVDSLGVGNASYTVPQTRKDVLFHVVELKQVLRRKYSDYNYRDYVGLAELLEKIQPNIIVVPDIYLTLFVQHQDVISKVKKFNIKLIMKDIPFQLDTMSEWRRKITTGYADSTYVPFFVPYFRVLCEKLKILWLFNLLGNLFTNMARKIVGKKVLMDRLEMRRRNLNFVDAHVNYVEKAYEIFGSYGVPKEKIFITYNSPDTDILLDIKKKIENEMPILPYSPHRIIHVGRLIEWKRVDMLIEALAILKKEFEDAELLILGFGPDEKALKDLAKKLHVEGSVKFIGGVYEPETLGKYLLSSGIYVLAGMGGISLNDAMTFGRPIICSVCDGTEKHLVKEGYNGLYFKNGDMLDLTEKIRYLFKNPELMKEMGEHSTNIIKNEINIHAVVRGYKQAFEYVTRTAKK